jgi:hypothetical protein
MRRLLLAVPLLLFSCSQDQINAAFGIRPAQAMVNPGALVQYAVTAAVTPTWSVLEVGGGTISSAGLYVAPGCPTVGTFHVQATAGGKTAQATVIVADGVASVSISPLTQTVPPGGSAQFNATVTSTCGAVSSSTMNISAPAAIRPPSSPTTAR